jgi:transposase-like protein
MADAGLNDSHQDSHQGSTYRRIELITGEAKRRLWTAEEKAGILSESFRPGAKVAEVARRHGVSRSLLWNWRHEARKRGMVAERAFVPVRRRGRGDNAEADAHGYGAMCGFSIGGCPVGWCDGGIADRHDRY